MKYENSDFHNMETDVDELMEFGHCMPTGLELRHVCRSGFGDLHDPTKNVQRLGKQMKEAKYRAHILKAPGSVKMQDPRMETSCPDWSTFVEICCAILCALTFPNDQKRQVVVRELQEMWEGMEKSVTYRIGKRRLTRNIFFVATGTGDLCFTCYEFDLQLDSRPHKAICYKSTKEVRNQDEGNNMRTRSTGVLECNSCLLGAQDNKVSVAEFDAAHPKESHKKVEMMLSGHLTYHLMRPNKMPKILKPSKHAGWSDLREFIR